MNRKIFLALFLFIVLFHTTVFSQIAKSESIAYVNSKELIDAMPAKQAATEIIKNLADKYKVELEMMQNEYNKKYSDYITYGNSTSETIKMRRMHELTELENKIEDFLRVSQKDIEEQEQKLVQPLREQLKEAIRTVGIEQNFTVVYDLDCPGVLFVSPGAINANTLVKIKLRQ